MTHDRQNILPSMLFSKAAVCVFFFFEIKTEFHALIDNVKNAFPHILFLRFLHI